MGCAGNFRAQRSIPPENGCRPRSGSLGAPTTSEIIPSAKYIHGGPWICLDSWPGSDVRDTIPVVDCSEHKRLVKGHLKAIDEWKRTFDDARAWAKVMKAEWATVRHCQKHGCQAEARTVNAPEYPASEVASSLAARTVGPVATRRTLPRRWWTTNRPIGSS